jgi:hypothetical protein
MNIMQQSIFPFLLLILISHSIHSQITVGEPAIPFALPDTSGVYFYSLQSESEVQPDKIVYQK